MMRTISIKKLKEKKKSNLHSQNNYTNNTKNHILSLNDDKVLKNLDSGVNAKIELPRDDSYSNAIPYIQTTDDLMSDIIEDNHAGRSIKTNKKNRAQLRENVIKNCNSPDILDMGIELGYSNNMECGYTSALPHQKNAFVEPSHFVAKSNDALLIYNTVNGENDTKKLRDAVNTKASNESTDESLRLENRISQSPVGKARQRRSKAHQLSGDISYKEAAHNIASANNIYNSGKPYTAVQLQQVSNSGVVQDKHLTMQSTKMHTRNPFALDIKRMSFPEVDCCTYNTMASRSDNHISFGGNHTKCRRVKTTSPADDVQNRAQPTRKITTLYDFCGAKPAVRYVSGMCTDKSFQCYNPTNLEKGINGCGIDIITNSIHKSRCQISPNGLRERRPINSLTDDLNGGISDEHHRAVRKIKSDNAVHNSVHSQKATTLSAAPTFDPWASHLSNTDTIIKDVKVCHSGNSDPQLESHCDRTPKSVRDKSIVVRAKDVDTRRNLLNDKFAQMSVPQEVQNENSYIGSNDRLLEMLPDVLNYFEMHPKTAAKRSMHENESQKYAKVSTVNSNSEIQPKPVTTNMLVDNIENCTTEQRHDADKAGSAGHWDDIISTSWAGTSDAVVNVLNEGTSVVKNRFPETKIIKQDVPNFGITGNINVVGDDVHVAGFSDLSPPDVWKGDIYVAPPCCELPFIKDVVEETTFPFPLGM